MPRSFSSFHSIFLRYPIPIVYCFIGIASTLLFPRAYILDALRSRLLCSGKCKLYLVLDMATTTILTTNATVCPWRHTHIDPLRRQRHQLLISFVMLLIAGTPLALHTMTMAFPQSLAIPILPTPASRLYSDSTDRLCFRRLGRKMRLLPPRPLVDRRETIVACCQLHTLLRASHHILPLDHRCSEV